MLPKRGTGVSDWSGLVVGGLGRSGKLTGTGFGKCCGRMWLDCWIGETFQQEACVCRRCPVSNAGHVGKLGCLGLGCDWRRGEVCFGKMLGSEVVKWLYRLEFWWRGCALSSASLVKLRV